MTEAQRQAIQEARDIDEGVDTRTKEEMLAEQMADLKSIRKTIKEEGPMFIAESTPGVGEAIAAKRTSDAIDEGNYVGAAIEGTAGALGLVPIIGDAASKGLRKAAKSVRKGYNPEDPASRVFHLTKKDFDTADVIGSGTSDIGFHVGTAAQANARGSTNIKYDKDLAEQMVKDERILPMVLKENLKPARIPDVSSFKEPMRWIGNMSVAKSDRQRIELLLGDPADAYLLAKAPRVTVGGDTYSMLPDVMRMGMDEKLWKDLILQAHKAKRIGLDTINNQKDRVKWFNTLKQTANKHGYDSFVYKNEHEGTDEQSLDALVEQIQKASRGEIDPSTIDMNSRFADSYMLLEPDQAKGLFGGMTKGDPKYMKNKGGLMLQEGGVVPMKEQMELFEDGGLMDQGGTVDPVSGNDVPPGSMQEEVRDDIPAQLSEGEFVFPADVVRYHGLDKLMEMRQEAKMGLKMMEEMGQMGNAEEATMPDDLPFDIEDLDIEDDNEPMEMQIGGYVPGQYQQGYGTYTLPGTGIMQQQPSYLSGYGQTPQQTYDYGVYNVPAYQQFTPATYTPEPYTGPTFEELIPSTTGRYDEIRRYVNAEGQVRMIPFVDGKPIYPIPPGFYPEAEAKQPDIPAPTDVYTGTARVREEGDGQREQQETQIFGGNVNTTKSDIYSSAVKAQAKHQLSSLSPVIGAGTSLFGGVSANDLAIAGNQARLAAVSSLGYDDISEVSTSDLDIVGNAMNIAYETVKDLTEEEGKPLGTARIKSISQFAADAASRDPETERAKIEAAKAARDAREKAALEEMERREKETIQERVARQINEAIAASEKTSAVDEAVPGGRFETAAVSPAKAAEARRQVEAERKAKQEADAREGRGNIVQDSSGKPVTSGGRPVTTRAGRELSRTEEGREQLERQAEAMREEAEEREREQQRQDIQEQQRREAAQKQEKDEREERERQERQQKAQEKGGAYAGTGSERGRGGRDDDGGGGGGGKIVCTEMYRQTQLDDWAKAIKIWDVYQKKHLTPYHEKGYHWLFKPYVQGMKKSNLLTKFGAYLAKQRTQHLRYVLTKGRAKDSIVGNIWCKIIHPIVYIAGRIK